MSPVAGGVAARPSTSVIGPPLTDAHFVPVARGGFGDAENTYAHSMAWFRDRLYVGVTRNALCGGRPYDRTSQYHVYPVKVPDIPWDLDWRAQIWRFDPSACRWDRVHVSPLVMGSRGFEIPRHYGFRDMEIFQGLSDPAPALYTVSWGSHMGPGPFVLRSADGETFEEVAPGERALFGSQTLRCLTAFKGRLFTSPTGRCGGMDTGHDDMVILTSADPGRGGWQVASEHHFGDRTNVTVFDMAVFRGFLYASTMNPYEGFQIWKTDAEGDPPFRWTRVIGSGAYRGKLNEAGLSLCVFGDALYVGTGIYHCGYDQIYKVGPGSPEMIRILPDDTWDLIVGEPRQTPDGLKVPLSGLGPGFNDPFAGYLWRMCAHDGWLYAATCVWTPWLPFARQENLLEAVQRVLSEDRLERLMRDFGGFDLWRSRDGRTWVPVTVNGFGNQYNCGVRSMASTPHGLFVGTVNQFGPEVAVRRAAGWRYEPNPRAGVEVWLGARQPLARPIECRSDPRRVAASPVPSLRLKVETGEPDLLRDLYGHTGWRHIGFWAPGTQTAVEACENLMEELLAFSRPDPLLKAPSYPTDEELKVWLARRAIPASSPGAAGAAAPQASVLDVGCGLGASTRYLARCEDRWDVIGATDDEEAVAICERQVPEARFAIMKLPKLRFPEESFDIVFCVEGPWRWGRRLRLYEEILRVLKPGGRLVASDIILDGEAAREAKDVTEYHSMLEGLGFIQARVLDVSSRTAEAFSEHSLEFCRIQTLAGRADADGVRQTLQSSPVGSGSTPLYLLLTALKRGTPELWEGRP